MLGMISLVIVAIVAGWETRAWWRERREAAERREMETYVRETELYVIAQEVAARRRSVEAARPYPLVARKVVSDEVLDESPTPLDADDVTSPDEVSFEDIMSADEPATIEAASREDMEKTQEIDPDYLKYLMRLSRDPSIGRAS